MIVGLYTAVTARFPLALAVVSMIGGVLRVGSPTAVSGLTLSHYDARGHLVVARRIFDRPHAGLRSRSAPSGCRCPICSTRSRCKWTRGTRSGASAVWLFRSSALRDSRRLDFVDCADAHRTRPSPRSPARRCLPSTRTFSISKRRR